MAGRCQIETSMQSSVFKERQKFLRDVSFLQSLFGGIQIFFKITKLRFVLLLLIRFLASRKMLLPILSRWCIAVSLTGCYENVLLQRTSISHPQSQLEILVGRNQIKIKFQRLNERKRKVPVVWVFVQSLRKAGVIVS